MAAAGLTAAAVAPVNPFANAADRYGRSLAALPPTLVSVWLVVAAVGLLLSALLLFRAGGVELPRPHRMVVVVAAAVALLVLDHSLIMLLGYLPLALAFLVMGRFEELSVLASPGLAMQALVAAGAAVVLLGVLQTPAGTVEAPAARTRKWVKIAVEAPLVYASTRVLMFFGVPGFAPPDLDEAMLWAGLGLAGAACVGALLTWGLIARWGTIFPRWVPLLRGRPVPVGPVVAAAMAVAVLVMAAFRSMVVQAVTSGPGALDEALAYPLISLPHLLWAVWSIALGMAAVNYRRRRILESKSVPAIV